MKYEFEKKDVEENAIREKDSTSKPKLSKPEITEFKEHTWTGCDFGDNLMLQLIKFNFSSKVFKFESFCGPNGEKNDSWLAIYFRET